MICEEPLSSFGESVESSASLLTHFRLLKLESQSNLSSSCAAWLGFATFLMKNSPNSSLIRPESIHSSTKSR